MKTNPILLKINWFAFAAGITTLILIISSMFAPWYFLRLGDNMVQINASPLNLSFSLQGEPFTIPILWALNMASLLSLAVGGIIMLIYSFIPKKKYSFQMIDFAYTKPLYAVVFFIVSLLSIILVIRGLLGTSLPLVGTSTIQLPTSLTFGTTISLLVTADFQWPFWLSITTAILCVAARLTHYKIAPKQPAASAPQTQPAPTSKT